MNRLAPLALLALSALALTACSASRGAGRTFEEHVLLETGTKLGGCAVGNFDPLHPGNEVAAVGSDGTVHLMRHVGRGWVHEVIGKFPGELIQCAGGDLVPNSPGDELIVVGIAEGGEDDGGLGVAYGIVHDGAGFQRTKIVEDSALLHAVCVGDIDPTRDGLELLLAGYSRTVLLLHDTPTGVVTETIGQLPGEAKGAAVGLGGAVVVCADGSLVRVRRDADDDDGDGDVEEWNLTTLTRLASPLARVAATEDEALFSANDGVLRLWRDNVVYHVMQSTDRLRGAVIAPVDPILRGKDVFATAGYDGNVSIIWPSEGGRPFTHVHVGTDTDKFHHLTAGELPNLGFALVGCGYSGRVLAWVGKRL